MTIRTPPPFIAKLPPVKFESRRRSIPGESWNQRSPKTRTTHLHVEMHHATVQNIPTGQDIPGLQAAQGCVTENTAFTAQN